MTDWYYHAPGQGRVGPLDAEEMRKRFRSRQIDRDTLAWHDGLREWQPVQRLIEELGLTGIQPDTSLPPPMPRRPNAATASHAGPMRSRTATVPPPNRTGCLIAALVIGILGLVMFAILAAVALPAYQDYVKRAKAAQSGQDTSPTATPLSQNGVFDAERMADTDALVRALVTAAMRTYYVANASCPDTYEFESLQVRYPRYQGNDNGWFHIAQTKPLGSQCAFEVQFNGLGPEVHNKNVRYEANMAGDEVTIACRNLTVPPGFLPPRCLVR